MINWLSSTKNGKRHAYDPDAKFPDNSLCGLEWCRPYHTRVTLRGRLDHKHYVSTGENRPKCRLCRRVLERR